jgi:hypothetical protein
MDGHEPKRHNRHAMFCPNNDCPDFIATGKHGEYVAGVTSCPVCGEYLVDALAPVSDIPREKTHYTDVEPVFETGDPTEVVVIQGLLESEDIPYVTTGAEKFDTFRGALSPMRYNPSAGITIFLVPTPLSGMVRQLLEEFNNEDRE